MHKLIPPYYLNIHFEGFPEVKTQRTNSFSVRHKAFKCILKFLTQDPACPGAQQLSVLPSTLQLFKGSDAVGRQEHTRSTVLMCISMPKCCPGAVNISYFRNSAEKSTREGNSSADLQLPFYFQKIFHRYSSKPCSCYHHKPLPIQAKHKKNFIATQIFYLIKTTALQA